MNSTHSTLVRATFPAGTLSGHRRFEQWKLSKIWSPTTEAVRRMCRIFLVFGSMDMGITIRTVMMKGNKGLFSGGAGNRGRFRAGNGIPRKLSKRPKPCKKAMKMLQI